MTHFFYRGMLWKISKRKPKHQEPYFEGEFIQPIVQVFKPVIGKTLKECRANIVKFVKEKFPIDESN